VATLTIDRRARRNAFNPAMWQVAGRLAERAPISLAGAKQLIARAAAGTAPEDAWAHRWYAAAAASAEYTKRAPDFTTIAWPRWRRTKHRTEWVAFPIGGYSGISCRQRPCSTLIRVRPPSIGRSWAA
jgi:hypothetical protein